MASLIKHKKVIIEGEIHICGGFCVCDVQFDEYDEMNYHKLAFDEGRTVPYWDIPEC